MNYGPGKVERKSPLFHPHLRKRNGKEKENHEKIKTPIFLIKLYPLNNLSSNAIMVKLYVQVLINQDSTTF